ncbi:MAG: M50 family metallopeptidase [Nesterenkonia sp.]|nr:M50 family metallopeptidase [Nesterenkonia sp.]
MIGEVFDAVARRWTSDAVADPQVVLILAAAAMAASFVPVLARLFSQTGTIVHEMGHVLAAWLTGRRVSGIRVHSDTSGVTLSRGRPRGPGMLLTALAGYPAPALLAWGLAASVGTGHAGAGLTLYQALLVIALMLSRNVVGVLSCAVSLVATGLIWWYATDEVVVYTVAVLAVVYAVAAVRAVLGLAGVHVRALTGRRSHRGHRAAEQTRTTDAALAARASSLPLPTAVWLVLLLLVVGVVSAAALWTLT